jgi:hypothetical protein
MLEIVKVNAFLSFYLTLPIFYRTWRKDIADNVHKILELLNNAPDLDDDDDDEPGMYVAVESGQAVESVAAEEKPAENQSKDLMTFD